MYYLHPLKALATNTLAPRYIRALMTELLGGGPVVYGKGDEPMLLLSGFSPDDVPAVNLTALMVYMWKRGMISIPPVAAAPIVNEKALLGGASPYFDFLELKTEEARAITEFYHKAKPPIVAVLTGGKDFEIATTTDVASQTLALRKITPNPHTPEGIFTIKYSHVLAIRVPPHFREFPLMAKHVAEILKQAVALPPVERRTVKVQKKEIYLLHGGREVEDGVLIDNDVYIYI